MNPRDAEAALHKALELDPQDCRAHIELGSLLEDQGKFTQAAAEFERAIAIDPNHVGAHCQLGRICRKQGRPSEAEAALRKALELDSQNGWARSELGSLYQDQDRFSEAAAEFEKAIAIDGDRGWVYCQLGRIYRGQGRSSEAEAALKQALTLGPQDGAVHIELGTLYQDQERFTEAAMELERALAQDRNNGWIQYQLGGIYRRQGRLSEAEAALRMALGLDPRNAGACIELGVLYEDQRKFPQAKAEFERAISIDSDQGAAHRRFGRICRRQGQSSEAEAALRKALELDPLDAGAYIELGVLHEDQRNFPQAKAELEKAISIDPRLGEAHRQLGRIYRRQERWPEAETALRRALELEQQDGPARMELGVLYQDQGRFSEAEVEFGKAIVIDPRNSGAHFHLGEIHGSCGRRLEAAAEFEKAKAIVPHDVVAYLCMGQMYFLWGQWAEAEVEFKGAVALEPRDDGAYIGLCVVYRGQGRSAEAEAALARAMAINPKSAVVCTELMDRLERDRAMGGLAGRPAGSGGALSPSLARDGAANSTRERMFCLLPWTNLHIRTDGSLRPCCMWSGPPLGNVRSSSIDELWNSSNMKSLRLDMMCGRPRAGCWRCYQDERAGFRSVRQEMNVFLGRHRGRERLTALDGTLPLLPVPLLDIRFSNVCNLRCRICDPMQSSAWMADAQALGLPVEGGPIHKPYDDWDAFWRQLQPALQEGLEGISFVGGEPLIMEEHYRILDFLIARGLTGVRLTYNTNFSTMRFQGRDVIDLWSRFHDVRVLASLDGSGRRGEYLRKDLNWEAVVANRKEMLRRCPDVAFSVFATLSIFNALHLPDFHREWVEKGYIDRDAFGLNVLVSPAMYRMQVLPAALKERVLESYRRHQESFLDAGGRAAGDFAAAARSLYAQDYSELLPDFVAMTRRLDQLRGEDCREVFPELAALFKAAT